MSYRDKESLIMFVVFFLSINSVGKLLKKAIMYYGSDGAVSSLINEA